MLLLQITGRGAFLHADAHDRKFESSDIASRYNTLNQPPLILVGVLYGSLGKLTVNFLTPKTTTTTIKDEGTGNQRHYKRQVFVQSIEIQYLRRSMSKLAYFLLIEKHHSWKERAIPLFIHLVYSLLPSLHTQMLLLLNKGTARFHCFLILQFSISFSRICELFLFRRVCGFFRWLSSFLIALSSFLRECEKESRICFCATAWAVCMLVREGAKQTILSKRIQRVFFDAGYEKKLLVSSLARFEPANNK